MNKNGRTNDIRYLNLSRASSTAGDSAKDRVTYCSGLPGGLRKLNSNNGLYWGKRPLNSPFSQGRGALPTKLHRLRDAVGQFSRHRRADGESLLLSVGSASVATLAHCRARLPRCRRCSSMRNGQSHSPSESRDRSPRLRVACATLCLWGLSCQAGKVFVKRIVFSILPLNRHTRFREHSVDPSS